MKRTSQERNMEIYEKGPHKSRSFLVEVAKLKSEPSNSGSWGGVALVALLVTLAVASLAHKNPEMEG